MSAPYSTDLRRKVIESLQEGNSLSKVARIFNLCRATVYSYIKRFEEGHLAADKKRSHPKKVSDDELQQYFKENPSATLVEAGEALNLHHSTVAVRLKKLNITRKKKTKYYQEGDPKAQEEFAEQVAQLEKDNASLCYVDETGVRESIHREHARAPKGEKVVKYVPGRREKKWNIIGGLEDNNFIAPMVFDQSCDSDLFCAWLENELLPTLKEGTYVIMDNASFHPKKDIEDILAKKGCYALFLPPYSPQLNKIEHTWHVLKSKIKTLKQTTKNALFPTILDSAINAI